MSEKLNSDHIFFVNKPSGVPTHQPSPHRLGFVEWCSSQLHQKLFVCHRLDKETSGALVFAKTKETAAQVAKLFEQRLVNKEYWLVSHKKSEEKEWVVEKIKGVHGVERPSKGGNFGTESLTRFLRINDQGTLFLYKAFPQTGKTHQIRKHAIQSKIPILGDVEYGGRSFPRLMLHSKSISFEFAGKKFEFEVNPSRLFQNLQLCLDLQLSSWIHSIERRESLFPELMGSKQSLRLCHSETGDLRMDKVGSRLVLGWWKSDSPTEVELDKIDTIMEMFDFKDWIFQWRPGVNQQKQLSVLKYGKNYKNTSWNFQEGEVKYIGSLERGQNFGLFLDQRLRRQWVKNESQKRRVLNLFAFTCGFSLNAALGGATCVVSVDSFQKYLDWGKENFKANGLEPNKYEFRSMDALEYLKFAQKKKIVFDLIICDPPSFSRHKKNKKIFRVERDFKILLDACYEQLATNGQLLFSTNYEKWDYRKWEQELKYWANSKVSLLIESSSPQWDFEWQNLDSNMKSFLIRKACSPEALDV